MTATTMRLEMGSIGARTRRAVAVSVAAHIVLLIGLALHRQLIPEIPAVTEVTWLEPPPPKPAPPPQIQAPVPQVEPVVQPAPQAKPEHFEREMPRGEVAPRPQDQDVRADRLEQRLAALTQTNPARDVLAGVPEPTGISDGMAVADVDVRSDASVSPVDLRRAETATGPPIALTRTASAPRREALAVPAAPAAPVAPAVSEAASATVQQVAGASLTGPVADRRLISYAPPSYPDWAKREGVEGSVSLRFIVLPDGRVKPGILIEKTSGREEFDRNAKEALLGWRFEPLEKGVQGEQWGIITFNYRLNEARR